MVLKKTNKILPKPSRYIEYTGMGIKMFLYILIGNWIGSKTAISTEKEYWEPLLTMIGVGLAMYTIISDVIRKSN